MGRYCAECDDYCDSEDFSNNQWRKGDGYSRCIECVNGRPCSDCGCSLPRDDYSNNQWNKGSGYSRCYDCVNQVYECSVCYRTFQGQNQLNMHMQVHRPRAVACPVCGDTRFRTGANAVQHVESGFCSGCRGVDNARAQIHQFAQGQRAMQQFMVPQLEYGGASGPGDVPDYPYQCRPCGKYFRQLSQLLQHQDQKHNNVRAIAY